MWELDCEESWVPKNWCFWTVVLEKTLESTLDYMEIKPVNPKGNQSWIFIEKINTEPEAPIVWPPGAKNWLTGKDLMLGKIEGRRRRDDKGWDGWMLSWLNGHEFEQAPGDGKRQGSLARCSPWGCKQSGMTKQLNNKNWIRIFLQNKITKKWTCCHCTWPCWGQ